MINRIAMKAIEDSFLKPFELKSALVSIYVKNLMSNYENKIVENNIKTCS